MWEIDYDAAAEHWINKDKESVHMDSAALEEKIEDFIKANNTGALATASGDFVRCTPIEYNYIGGAFYLLSEGGLKFKALKDNIDTPEYIEQLAREKLDMYLPNERVYIDINSK